MKRKNRMKLFTKQKLGSYSGKYRKLRLRVKGKYGKEQFLKMNKNLQEYNFLLEGTYKCIKLFSENRCLCNCQPQ
jgi:hypothetical protein